LKNKIPFVIAIDGPAGSGKGTVAKKLSSKLDFHYLDSGAIYRVIAFAAKKKNINIESTDELINLVKNSKIEFFGGYEWLDGANISDLIRVESIGKLASEIAIYDKLRTSLLEYQRSFCKLPGLVAEGRDMTSVVFPNANLKIYLDASVAERAKRRHEQLMVKGKDVSIQNLTDDITARDKLDKERIHSPLSIADDAFVLNSDDLSIDQTVNKILKLI